MVGVAPIAEAGRVPLFTPIEHGGGGKNIRQVSAWLGQADPAFTLRRYVHLIDGGLGDADFLDVIAAPAGIEATASDDVEAVAV